MSRLLSLAKSALFAAALTAPTIVQANVIRCTGTDLDIYWKIEPNGSTIDARFWQSGQWSRNVCNDAPLSEAGGYKCEVFPEQYVLTFWKPKPDDPDNSFTNQRIAMGRGDGFYEDGWWDRPGLPAFSSVKQGKCVLSPEPAPITPMF